MYHGSFIGGNWIGNGFSGELSPGIYLVGIYYSDSGSTFNNEFDIRYFVIDDDGNQFGSRQAPLVYNTPTLILGSNTVNMSVTPGVGTQTKTVTMWLPNT